MCVVFDFSILFILHLRDWPELHGLASFDQLQAMYEMSSYRAKRQSTRHELLKFARPRQGQRWRII